jgi:hypothetical protein
MHRETRRLRGPRCAGLLRAGRLRAKRPRAGPVDLRCRANSGRREPLGDPLVPIDAQGAFDAAREVGSRHRPRGASSPDSPRLARASSFRAGRFLVGSDGAGPARPESTAEPTPAGLLVDGCPGDLRGPSAGRSPVLVPFFDVPCLPFLLARVLRLAPSHHRLPPAPRDWASEGGGCAPSRVRVTCVGRSIREHGRDPLSQSGWRRRGGRPEEPRSRAGRARTGRGIRRLRRTGGR